MKRISILLSLLTASQIFACFGYLSSNDRHFPLTDYTYLSDEDVGFAKYLSPDLHGTKKVVLTFDDGPHEINTPKLLDILKQYDVQATFFVVVSRINETTLPIIERMYDEGHIVASHDWDHENNNQEDSIEFKSELVKSLTKLESIEIAHGAYQNEVYYRYPFGAYGYQDSYHHMNILRDTAFEMYGNNCINFAFWDIDTADWVRNMTSQDISQNIISHIYGGTGFKFVKKNGKFVKKSYTINDPVGGGVVLMHDIHSKTVKATEIFIKAIKDTDIEIVSLREGQNFAFPYLCDIL